MRHFSGHFFTCCSWTSALVVAGLLLNSGAQMHAQANGQGAGQGRRGAYGQMGEPVRGIVTAVTPGKVTVKTESGDAYVITASDTSRIMRNRQPIKLSDITVGDSVTAMGQVDATQKTVQAMMVMDIDAATVAKAEQNMGKTYITGKITAIDADNLKLTVMRSDNVSQVIAVDEGTSFERGDRGVAADVVAAGGLGVGMGGGFGGGRGGGRRGEAGGAQGTPPPPESITLADVKVGDVVMATGALKNGTFTVLKIGVSEPGVGGGRRRGEGEQPAPAASGATQPPAAAPPQ